MAQAVQTVQSSPAQKGPGYASVTRPHFLQQLLSYSVPSTQSYAVPPQLANGQPLFNGEPIGNQPRIGDMDRRSVSYDPTATQHSGQYVQPRFGCTDSRAYSYNPRANINYPGACWYAQPPTGCTNPQSLNYDPSARKDNGTCIKRVQGCTNVNAVNFDPLANTDDGSCTPLLFGCTNPKARNFDSNATVDSGECWYGKQGCMNPKSPSYDWRVVQQEPGSCCPEKPTQVAREYRDLAPGVPIPCTSCCDK